MSASSYLYEPPVFERDLRGMVCSAPTNLERKRLTDSGVPERGRHGTDRQTDVKKHARELSRREKYGLIPNVP